MLRDLAPKLALLVMRDGIDGEAAIAELLEAGVTGARYKYASLLASPAPPLLLTRPPHLPVRRSN